jgi:hypothetical protein
MIALALSLCMQQDALEEILRSPFSEARANFFHAALEVPPLESADALPRGTLYVRLRAMTSRSNEETRGALKKDDFDGQYEEFGALVATWAPWERFEVTARAVYAGWDEKQDRFRLYDGAGTPIVTGESRKLLGIGATHRHANLSVFGVGAKWQFLQSEAGEAAVSLSAKIPFGRDHDLTHAGTTDVALALLAGRTFGWGTLHAQLGVTVPFGEQNLFEDEADVDLNPFAFAAVGAVVPLSETWAVGMQLEANASAFRDVEFLDGTAVTAVVGVRKLFGRFVAEAGGGGGFDWSSSYQFMAFMVFGVVF